MVLFGGRAGIVVALYPQEETLAFDGHFRALDDRYSVSYEIFLWDPFLDTAKLRSKFLFCILEDVGHYFLLHKENQLYTTSCNFQPAVLHHFLACLLMNMIN